MGDLACNGVRLHVQRLGTGAPAVVFLHGLLMDNLSSWYFTVANAVATRREALLYDLRGHGMSERPAAGFDLDTHIADLAALLAVAGLDRPVALVGNSFGGLLAIAFAIARPERVARIALVDALLPEPGWGDAMGATLSIQGPERDAVIARSFASWLGRNSERKRNRLARQAEALVAETTLVADLRRSRSYRDEELAAIACPVLAIYGEASDQRDRGERLARTLPRCTLELLPGCSHSVLWEATARLRDRIVAFTGDA
ncbi:MAG: alpha/beta fold hydrolase [Acidobacteriota bacterium]